MSTSERGFEITYSRQKISGDSFINWSTMIRDYLLTQKKKIPVDSYINWQINPRGFIHQLVNEDSRSHTHAKNPN